MATVSISGRAVQVDEEDVAAIEAIRWRIDSPEVLLRHGNKPYAKHTRCGYLHKWLLGIGRELQVDHKNGDTLDNRKDNLRVAVKSQNCWNTKVYRGASRLKGATPAKSLVVGKPPRWVSQIKHHRKTIYLGTFNTSLEAALAYDAAAVRLFGEFAAPNFPERVRSLQSK